MIPDGLKVGDTYVEDGVKHIITKVCVVGPARYESKVYEEEKKAPKEEVKEEVKEEPTEVKPRRKATKK